MQPRHRQLYTMQAVNFFVPSFLQAINENTEEGFRRIISEPTPGIYTFEMVQPRFCEMLLSEVASLSFYVGCKIIIFSFFWFLYCLIRF